MLLSKKLNGVNMAALEALWANHERLDGESRRIREAVEAHHRASDATSSHFLDLTRAERDLSRAMEEFRAMAGKPCDECGRPLDEACLVEAA